MTAPDRLSDSEAPPLGQNWRGRLHQVIFESDTPAGRAFDLVLLVCILASVFAVLLESVRSLRLAYGPELRAVEWFFTLLFTVEYVLRLIAVRRPLQYIFSFFGAVDLLAILPTYLSLLLPGAQALLVVRALRLLRVFRILKLSHFLGEAQALRLALRASLRKITVFLGTVIILVLIIGALMYLVEGEKNGFTSIPQSMYWAVVTLTTVGYGDIAPATVLGRMLASIVMIIGYGIIAVPTGIVTVELSRARSSIISGQACPHCGAEGHDADARFCKYCGSPL
jgi:voltage-gated potassium channel